ncbi:Peroxiredoxin [Candidatus Trichorickettsia mobilis]|uniref:thioredoxin-dependent peroxiredoxin n=1 Tax=Candidatus Trichorickettsia mobilis TaxID=1346319 RepID=A0ABZ0UTB6_9RICK|nr:thioredoxin-dependent thiol peroxidase [Candidatus Trichorickettsia mobilis]WPY01026.1 Peroxiredoxin [Candidatus Trichorickettsia mobilis]
MTTLNIGDIAPDFTMPIKDGTEITLSKLKGKIVVLYFYPKDDTPGCTLEAQAFNILKPEFAKINAVIIGISKDNISSHNKFQDKYCLQFDLASDADSDTCQRYGVWVEKSMYGKKYMGINRATFIIDQTGKIKHIWSKVSIDGHAQEVLDFCKTL